MEKRKLPFNDFSITKATAPFIPLCNKNWKLSIHV